jgi:hypothetical protein
MEQVTDAAAAAAAMGREATNAAAKVGANVGRFAQRALFMVAERGVEGIRTARSALNQIPLGVPGNIAKKVNIRKLFLMKHGELATTTVPEDDVSSDDELRFTDDQVQEKVGKHYFDKSYDAVRAELMLMEEGEDFSALEEAVKDRRAKVMLVSTTLKKRLNENHTRFEECIKQICQINDGLLETSSECKGGRRLLFKAKDSFVMQALMVPRNHRRRQHLRALHSVVSAVNELYSKYFKLLSLVETCEFVEAAKMISNPETKRIREEETLMVIASLSTVIDAWHNFTMSNVTLLSCIDQCIEDCLSSGKFNEARYKQAIEASYILGDQEKTYMGVAQSLWRSAVQVLTKSITYMSMNKEEGAMLDEIARNIAPEHLLPTFNQLCGKTIDFLFQYSQVARCHIEGQKVSRNSKHHQQALEFIKPVAKKIGLDLHEKIHVIMQVIDLDDVDIEKTLHIFLCVNLLIESTIALGLDQEQMQAARSGVKGPLVQSFARTFHKNKVDVIASFLVDDSWAPDEMTLGDMRIVKPLAPEAYRNEVKFVKGYLADLTVGPSMHDNPFYSQKLLSPQDMSAYFETESYLEAAARITPPLPTDRCLMTASGVLVANTMFEYVAKVAVRFPPLATEIVQWCEQLACVYIFSVSNTFVSVSRDVPLEQQSDFSLSTRRALIFVNDRCKQAFAHSGVRGLEQIKLAFGQVQTAMSSAAEMFGIEHRVTAVESCFSILAALRASVGSLSRLMKREPLEEFQQHADMLYDAIDELLHVIVHRICQAIPIVESVTEDLAKVKFNGRDLQESSYTVNLAARIVQYVRDLRTDFAVPHLRTVFIRRLVFAVQANMARGYAKQAKKLTDMQITHMQIDAKAFSDAIEKGLGPSMIPLPRYTRDFINGAFDATDKTQPNKWKDWLCKNHMHYSVDMLRMLMSNGDKDRRQEVDEYLVSLGHIEAIPVIPLRVTPIHAPSSPVAREAEK